MSDSESHNIEGDNYIECKTRRNFIRQRLYAKTYEEITRKNTPPQSDAANNASLKKQPLPEDATQMAALNSKYPLHDPQKSQAISFWQVHSRGARQFRRTYEMAKPDFEYFREKQWR